MQLPQCVTTRETIGLLRPLWTLSQKPDATATELAQLLQTCTSSPTPRKDVVQHEVAALLGYTHLVDQALELKVRHFSLVQAA